ncbi:MAG: sialate O-acetylesterase [Opitutaceae bacterium]|jgi:sialate O-acetylesterase
MRKFRPLLSSLTALGFAAGPLLATVKPNALFSDHMVLQSGISVPVWGTAAPGEKITVAVGGQQASAVAGADGRWQAKLNALKSGGPLELSISGDQTPATLVITDVLVGEVWVGSGQSNMEFTVSKAKAPFAGLLNEEQEIAAANFPQIRMFTVKGLKTYEPQTEVTGQWLVCSPTTVPGFSAVGYLFARDLQRELNVPVGIITSAAGASCAEAWISREAMTDPKLKWMLDSLDASVAYFRQNPQGPAAGAPIRPTPINKPRAAGPVTRLRDPVQDQHFPTVLFNGMINPIIPYAIKGVIWYQGESIIGGTRGLNLYGYVQKALITDWRKRWGEGNFPFYIVQLPGQENISNNPRIREEQMAVLSLPNTGMAVTIDIGEARNVHPHNKEPLGERLTRIALANAYGRKLEAYGPMYGSMTVVKDSVRVTFNHLGGGLVAKGGPLKGFQVAGADQKFVDADARIDGDTVVVSSAQVPAPVAVRYAFTDYPEGWGCNLYNAAGLPAAPFRSDQWNYPVAGIVEN